jgi:hypothetical protein
MARTQKDGVQPVKRAQEQNLVVVREISGVQVMWLAMPFARRVEPRRSPGREE